MNRVPIHGGVVVATMGLWNKILTEEGKTIQAKLKGKHKLQISKATNPLCVGDKVLYSLSEDNIGQIEEIKHRENYICRKIQENRTQFIAANIDKAVLIVTIKYPKTAMGFIDRFLLFCQLHTISVLILFNKIDLYRSQKEIQKWKEIDHIYQKIGYDTISVSIYEKEKMEELKTHLKHKISVFVGLSGVGKSSILNTLIPQADQKVQKISRFSKKGVHTTSTTKMFAMDTYSFLIDIPGIKFFGLEEMEIKEISSYFVDFSTILEKKKCIYQNCMHISEPGCEIRKAVETGEIFESRYKNYLNMIKKTQRN